MAKQPHTPESLAAYLDQILAGNSPNLENDPLVETALKLQNAPKPVLSDAALARIEGKLFAAQSTDTTQARSSRQGWQIGSGGLAIAIVVAVVLALGGFFDEDTSEQSDIIVEGEATEAINAVDSIPAVNIADELNLPPVIVLEGPIEALDDTSVTVFGMTFDASYDVSILGGYEVGDEIRIQGSALTTDEQTVFVVLEITLAEDAEIPLRTIPLSVKPTVDVPVEQPQEIASPPEHNTNTAPIQNPAPSVEQQPSSNDRATGNGQAPQNDNRDDRDEGSSAKDDKKDEGSQ